MGESVLMAYMIHGPGAPVEAMKELVNRWPASILKEWRIGKIVMDSNNKHHMDVYTVDGKPR